MTTLDPRTWLEHLPKAECWRLLRLSTVGRLAVVVGSDPTIWPLNIAVHDGEPVVVFRTGPGSKLAAFEDHPKAALEVDGLDYDERRGWSVIATGKLQELSGTALRKAQDLPLAPWTVGDKPRWFGLHVQHISGRAIGDRAASTTGPSRPQ